MIKEVLILSCDDCSFTIIQGQRVAAEVEDDAMMENLARELGWVEQRPRTGFGRTRHRCPQCVRRL